jgi:hypothetical protein
MEYPVVKNAVCPEEHKYFTSIYLPESLLYGGEGEVYLVCDHCRRRYTTGSSLMQLYHQEKLPKILEKIVLLNNKIFHTKQKLHPNPELSKLVGPFIDTVLNELSNMIYDIFAGRFVRWNRLSPKEEVVNRVINHLSDVFLNSFEVVTTMANTGRLQLARKSPPRQVYQQVVDIFTTRQVQEYQYLELGAEQPVVYSNMKPDLLEFYRQPRAEELPVKSSREVIRNTIPRTM